MSLEKLLKPVKIADEEILRKFTKHAQDLESKGKSRYTECYIGAVVYIIGTHFWIGSLSKEYYSIPLTYLSGFMVFSDVLRTGEDERKKKNISSGEKVDYRYSSPFSMISKATSKYIRLPTMVAAAGFGVKGIYELATGVINQDLGLINDALRDISIGVGFYGISSSMYLKDADPNILKKDSIFTKAKNWAKEKYEELKPAHVPQPVPIQYLSNVNS